MGVCRYCGRKAGWFRNAHDECAKKARKENEAVQPCAAESGVQAKQQVDVRGSIEKAAPAPDIGKWRSICAFGHNIVTTFWLTSESPSLSRRGSAELSIMLNNPPRIYFDPKIAIAGRGLDHGKPVPMSVDNGPFVYRHWWQLAGRESELEIEENECNEVFEEIVNAETLTMRVNSNKGWADVIFRVAGVKNALNWAEAQATKRHELEKEFQDKISKAITITVTRD